MGWIRFIKPEFNGTVYAASHVSEKAKDEGNHAVLSVDVTKGIISIVVSCLIKNQPKVFWNLTLIKTFEETLKKQTFGLVLKKLVLIKNLHSLLAIVIHLGRKNGFKVVN